MTDEKESSAERDPIVRKARRIATIGGAILVSGSLAVGAWTVVTKTYAFAQRVEVYVGLPDWLKTVEAKIDKQAEELKSTRDDAKETRRMVRRLYLKEMGRAPEPDTPLAESVD